MRQFVALRPVDFGGCAEHLAYLGHLVGLALAGEEGTHGEELGHDGTQGEDVDGGVVVGGTQEDLGRSVPTGAHVVGEGGSAVYFFC